MPPKNFLARRQQNTAIKPMSKVSPMTTEKINGEKHHLAAHKKLMRSNKTQQQPQTKPNRRTLYDTPTGVTTKSSLLRQQPAHSHWLC